MRGDVKARVIEYVTANPGSTAGDVAGALGLKRNSVATRLAQLAKSGVLVKAQRGYAAP
jgi:predicted ArsR family transcriptional regulator